VRPFLPKSINCWKQAEFAAAVCLISAKPCDFEAYVDTIIFKPAPFTSLYLTLTMQAQTMPESAFDSDQLN
jgi:hypothetical protein